MLPPAIQRLLWKDARTLLPIWGALLAVVVAIQFVVFAMAWLYRDEVPMADRNELWSALCGIGAPLAFCYAAAAAGILFAGETESETDDWLRLLPVSPSVLAGCKVGMALMSLLAFTLVVLTTAALGMAAAPWETIPLITGKQLYGAIVAIPLISLLAMSTAVFLSVRMKRVVPVVAGSLVLTLPLIGLAGWFANDVLGLRNGYDLLAVFATLGLLDLWLVLRWCKGESVALPRPTAWIESVGERLAIGRSFSVNWLQRLAKAGNPWRRAFGVQLWRELRSAIPFALVWGVVGLFFLLPTVLHSSRWFPIEVIGVFAMLYWLVTPGLCGLQASAGDQRAGQQLFLGQRGVSTTSTWLAKQLVWLSLAAVLAIGWGWMQDGLSIERQGRISTNQLADSYLEATTRHVHTPRLSQYGVVTPEDVSLRREYLLSLLLSLYAVGQLCGFWFRNVFVAGAVMLFLHVPVGQWHFVLVTQDVPLWMGAGPLIVLWLAATWWLMDPWLTGRFAEGLRWRRCVWLIGPCLVAMGMYSIARRTQIPVVEFPDYLTEHLQQTRLPPQSISTRDSDDWVNWTESLQRHVELAKQSSRPEGANGGLLPVDATLPDPSPLDAKLLNLAANLRIDSSRQLPISHWTPTTTYRDLANYIAARRAAAQDPQHSDLVLTLHLDGLFVLKSAALHYPGAMQPALEARQTVLASLAAWVQDAGRTQDQLQRLSNDRRLIEEVTSDDWPTPEQLAHAYAETVRQLRDKQGPDFKGLVEIANRSSTYGLWPWRLLHIWSRLNGDHARTDRLLNVLTQEASSLAQGNRPAGAESQLTHHIERWWATTRAHELALPNGYLGDPIVRLQDDVLTMTVDLASRRGLWLLTRLELHRHKTGGYPQALHELELHAQLPLDPFTGADFVYLPQGLDAAWLLANDGLYSARVALRSINRHLSREETERALTHMLGGSGGPFAVIPARQPILFSAGPHRGTYTYQPAGGHMVLTDQERAAAEAAGAVPDGIYREVVAGEIDGGGPWRISMAMNRASQDARPAFVVLGADFTPWGAPIISDHRGGKTNP